MASMGEEQPAKTRVSSFVPETHRIERENLIPKKESCPRLLHICRTSAHACHHTQTITVILKKIAATVCTLSLLVFYSKNVARVLPSHPLQSQISG